MYEIREMFRTILILSLLNLTEITISIDSYNFCESDYTGLNKCHDGGCNNNNKYDTENVCLCSFSQTVTNGKYCGIYEDKCTTNPCVNNGKCISGIGHHVCECSNGFHGINCEIPIAIGKLIAFLYWETSVNEYNLLAIIFGEYPLSRYLKKKIELNN